MSEEITRWRKKPVVIEAIQWTGANKAAVEALTGPSEFDVLDEHDRINCDDPEATATVFDKLHSTWILVYDGQWIIKGIKGEFYPCADDVFRETYEPAGGPQEAATPVGALAAEMQSESDRYRAASVAEPWTPDRPSEVERGQRAIAVHLGKWAKRVRELAPAWDVLARERDEARAVVAEMIAAYGHIGRDRWVSEVPGSRLPVWHDRAGLEARDE